MTRGQRNNNLGNIKLNPNFKWNGQTETNTDGVFVQFFNLTYGIRALLYLIITYWQKKEARTLRQFINIYAPTSENNTKAYIKYVSKKMGLLPDSIINLSNKETLFKFANAIIAFENKGLEINNLELDKAFQLLPNYKKKILRQSDYHSSDLHS